MLKHGKFDVGGCEYDGRELDDLVQQAVQALSCARALSLRTADSITNQTKTDLLQAAAQMLGQVQTMSNLYSMELKKLETEPEDGRSRL